MRWSISLEIIVSALPKKKRAQGEHAGLAGGSFDIKRHSCACVEMRGSRCPVPTSLLFISFKTPSLCEKGSRKVNTLPPPECKHNQHLPLVVPRAALRKIKSQSAVTPMRMIMRVFIFIEKVITC